MEVSGKSRGRSRFGNWILVILNAALALALTLGLTWIAGRPGLRVRADLTVNEANTLDENARNVIDNLQDKIEIDVFFRPYMAPMDRLGQELHQLMFEVLVLAEDYAPDKIKLTNHPYAAPGSGGAELLEEMKRFGISDSNVFVVSNGKRRVAMTLLGEVAEVELGNPSRSRGAYRPPSLLSFRGVETLIKGILRVTQGEKPLALFVTGHGERPISDPEDGGMGRLELALVEDGFRVKSWDASDDGPIPSDCDVLALIGGDLPLSQLATDWIKEYVHKGGSLIAAPGEYPRGDETSVRGILHSLGIDVVGGVVARPVTNAAGISVTGEERVVQITVRADNMRTKHPITDVLIRTDRRAYFPYSKALMRGKAPNKGVLLDLLRTDEHCWLELSAPGAEPNYRIDEGIEPMGPFSLGMTSVFEPDSVGPVPIGENSTVRECRVLAYGTELAFANAFFDVNRDLLVNSFNWAANREFRVSVAPIKRDDRRLDLREDGALSYVSWIAIWLLPLLCLALAAFSAWRRRH